MEALCLKEEPITLKLELDYKLSASLNSSVNKGIEDINEFLYFNGEELIGYLGICAFGGNKSPLEITGMVHPGYRRQGVFTRLFDLVLAECRRRQSGGSLGLCDNRSLSGQQFLKKIGAKYSYSEFEMYLSEVTAVITDELLSVISLEKARNADAGEIARQNAIYFGEAEDEAEEGLTLPEEEERRGMTIYLAKQENRIIGKTHLQLIKGLGGIYGLGILPEERGKGLGRALLLKSIQALKEAGAKDVMLQVAADNETALNLYKSCGFKETSVMDYFSISLS